MTFGLSSQECRHIFQCYLYLLTCFTATYFFLCFLQFGTELCVSRKNSKSTPLFISGVVHATSNIKDIYSPAGAVRPMCFHNGPYGKNFQRAYHIMPIRHCNCSKTCSFRECYHPCISPAFGTANLSPELYKAFHLNVLYTVIRNSYTVKSPQKFPQTQGAKKSLLCECQILWL
jgi:hypothetical protein